VLDYLTSEGGCEVPEECETCMLANECSHGCPSAQKDLFDNLGIMPYVGCKNLKILFNLAIIMMKVLTEANNELFKQQINMKINNACKKGCC
jgi:sulfatase maturation enzyme AslB (radical SAM superfamily)